MEELSCGTRRVSNRETRSGYVAKLYTLETKWIEENRERKVARQQSQQLVRQTVATSQHRVIRSANKKGDIQETNINCKRGSRSACMQSRDIDSFSMAAGIVGLLVERDVQAAAGEEPGGAEAGHAGADDCDALRRHSTAGAGCGRGGWRRGGC